LIAVPDNPRIEELRRRVQKDPASIAFAQLAEEHRRAGQYEEAIEVAKAGLQQHPAYLSARVTLGRALIEVGRLDEAADEFEYVVNAAPDNLTAVRQLADIHQRRRQVSSDTKSRQPEVKAAPVIPLPAAPAPPPPPLAPSAVEGPIAPVALPPVPKDVVIQPSPRMPAAVIDVETAQVQQPPAASVDMVVAELEAWLAVLVEERSGRPSSDAGRH
jgi:tetratricopeptide (TPR) repeat protein